MASSIDYLRAALIYQQGLKDYRAKNWEAAKATFTQALHLKPDFAAVHFKVGMCHFRLEEWQSALEAMQTAIALDPSKKRWIVQRDQSIAYLDGTSKMSLKEEEQFLQAKISVDQTSAENYKKLAANFRKQARTWQEIEALKAAVERAPDQAKLYFDLGHALDKMRRYKEAAAAFGEASKLRPGNAEYAFRMGFSYEREGFDGPAEPDKAAQAFDLAIEADGTGAAAKFGVGVFHQERGFWREAAAAYEQQAGRDPYNAELFYRLGLAYDRLFDWKSAERHIQRSLSLNHSHAHRHNRLGFVLERQSKYEQAAAAYAHAAELMEKGFQEQRYRQGFVLTKAGLFEEAINAFRKMKPELAGIADDPTNEASSALTDPYLEKLMDRRIALLATDPPTDMLAADGHANLAEAYAFKQEWQAASAAFSQAVLRSDDHIPDWYFRLGNALAHAGRPAEACEAFVETRRLTAADGWVPRKALKNPAALSRAAYAEYYERLPIKERTVLYESFHGRSMTCNPLAIFRELLSRKEFADWTHIWVVNDRGEVPQEFRQLENVVFISRISDAYMRALASTKVLINNATFPAEFVRKDDQIYLNTWHGTPIKTLGKFIQGSVAEHANTARNFLQSTHLLSPNPHTSDVLIDHYDISGLFRGEIAETGYPRIDATLATPETASQELRRKLGAGPDQKILLYAPTFRGSFGDAVLDSDGLIADIEAMQRDGYHLVFRGHYETEKMIRGIDFDCTVVPAEIDSNSLLSVVDLLVSDYSSIAFDFLPRRKPIVYYAYDLYEYENERGLYFPLSDLPGEIVQERGKLAAAIDNADARFDASKHDLAIDRFAPMDDGRVSQRVVDWVFLDETKGVKVLPKARPTETLFYPGSMMPNGITTSFINLTSHIDRENHKIACLIDANIAEHEDRVEQLAKLPQDIEVVLRVGAKLFTPEEQWIESKLDDLQYLTEPMIELLRQGYSRELRRQLGPLNVANLVNFDGYTRLFHRLFAFAPKEAAQRKVLYLHNDMVGEWRERIPHLEGICRLYDEFDTLVSVSASIGEVNRKNLSDEFGLEDAKFTYAPNVLNPQYTLDSSSAPLEVPEDELIFQNASPIFVTMARLSVEKGQEKLIRAFAKVARRAPRARLLILGDGPLREHLNSVIKQLGLNRHVSLLGHRRNPFPYLKRSDCFVFPSNHEGQGLVLLEAMTLGLPVIASDIPTSREILSDTPERIVENTEEAFAEALLQFIENPLSDSIFDVAAYQKEALAMFNRNVIGGETD